MKRISMITTLAATLIALGSCNKTYCWECKNKNSGKDTTYCDKTKKEIKNIEQYSTDDKANFLQIECTKK